MNGRNSASLAKQLVVKNSLQNDPSAKLAVSFEYNVYRNVVFVAIT